MANPVMQFQILTKTPEETARFYAELFGWTIDPQNALGYRRINTTSEKGIQGGIWPAPAHSPDFVQLFIGVQDIRATVKAAKGLGARVLIPPTVLPDGDEMAVLHDPHGMSFAVWRPAVAAD